MRILVFSDTHGDISGCTHLLRTLPGIDMVLHAGDHAGDAKALAALFPEIPVEYVRGNCDGDVTQLEKVVEVCGKQIFLTHGHLYRVKSDCEYSALASKTKAEGYDLTVFGHTHLGYNNNFGRFLMLNPGSIKYGSTYGVVEIENGQLKTALCSL